jgi:hypothetical protein
MRSDKPTDEIACWWEETKISTHLRHAAGICVLTTGLLVGSASGAIAAADTGSTGSTSTSHSADESSQSVSTTSTPTTSAAETSTKSTHPTPLRDVIRKLQELGKPRTRPVVATGSTTDPVAPDTKTDSNAPPNATPAAPESGGSDSTVVAPESNSTKQKTNNTDLVASHANGPAPSPSPPPPSLSTVVIVPVTHAVGTVVGAALSVPGLIVSLPSSQTPVADVITAVQNILISVNDAVVPLVQMPFDLYSLLVVAGMGSTPVDTIGNSFGGGLIVRAPAATAPPPAPVPPSVPPATSVAGMPLLGHVSAPASLGGVAKVGLSTNLSLTGTAPIAADSAIPTTALSLLEHTVKAVLAPASLSALAAFALPGVGGLLIICAAGMRVGYRQAKAALAVRTTGISRFARQGPLGVVRSGSLVVAHPRRARTLRVIRPERSAAAPPLEEAA